MKKELMSAASERSEPPPPQSGYGGRSRSGFTEDAKGSDTRT
jgi:hypothetical protein